MNCVVFLHAHPDDEALLSGGTLRGLHQKGIRTVVIFLTNGERGLADTNSSTALGEQRKHEALKSSKILGVSKTYFLDYGDSGLHAEFAESPVRLEEMCERVKAILEIEQPNTFITYDAEGGYGHPDHKIIHRIGRQLLDVIDVPNQLEVTIDRSVIASTLDRLRYAIKLLERLHFLQSKDVYELADRFSPSADIAYRINVRPYATAKRSALKAHASQSTGGMRTLRIMTLIPNLIFKRLFGTEWYVAIRDSRPNPLSLLK